MLTNPRSRLIESHRIASKLDRHADTFDPWDAPSPWELHIDHHSTGFDMFIV